MYDKTQPENLQFIERLRALTDRYPGAALLGEIGDDHQYRTLAAYTLGDKRLHMAYVFKLLERDCSAAYLHGVLDECLSEARDAFVCWSVGNHDVERVASRWRALGGSARDRAELAARLLLALPGAKCVYQGEELGLTEADVPYELLQDPYGLTMWPENKGRDGCRTPMPWTDEPGAGFSTGTPWLPVAPEHLTQAAARQLREAGSLHARYVDLLRWQREEPALRGGVLRLLPATDQVLAFERVAEGRTMLCLFNLSDRPALYPLPAAGFEPLPPASIGARIEGQAAELAPLGVLFARTQENMR